MHYTSENLLKALYLLHCAYEYPLNAQYLRILMTVLYLPISTEAKYLRIFIECTVFVFMLLNYSVNYKLKEGVHKHSHEFKN